jgi:acyl carrier protein
LAVQYVDYTLWQRAQLGDFEDSDSRIAAQLAYWQQALAGMPERLQLPTDRPYPLIADYRGAQVAVDWPVELQQRVRGVAGEHNATSFMVIQAALTVLLAKISASADVAVGFPIAGRRDPALDELVGFFVNTLVLRVDMAGDPTFIDLLAQVRRRCLAAYEHQDVPFEVLVDRLNPTRSLAHHPLVQVVLAWQNNDPAAGLALGDLEVSPLPADTRTARMDLTFSLAERWTAAGEPAGIGGTVEFRTDVFDAASIETLIGRLQKILVAMTADPTRRLSSMDLLDTDEHALLEGWGNQTVLTKPATPKMSAPEPDVNGGGYRAPATQVEQILADIYNQVLGLEQVGVDESFFELGGDSLSAMRVIAAVNKSLDANLAVRTLFHAPSVRSLSQQMAGSPVSSFGIEPRSPKLLNQRDASVLRLPGL